jgi:hypothetical protein
MENISQNLPSVLTSESVAATGITATEATVVGLPPLGKKRKPNANGPRKTSPAGTTLSNYLMKQFLLQHANTVIKNTYVTQKPMELPTCLHTQRCVSRIH